jgi:UDP-glucose 4-epimerase
VHLLVTGGAGFIGSHVCERLLDEGHSVVAVDDLSLGDRRNVAGLGRPDSFELLVMDVADVPAMRELFATHRFDCVYHFAANSDIARSHADPDTDFHKTLLTTFAVLEGMRESETRQLVFASTSAIYGEAAGRLREDRGPLMPISHYGAAKLASEGFISSYGENYGIQSWMPRFPNVVGDRATHGAVYDFVRKLKRDPSRLEVLGNGEQVKPYLHVSDLLDAIFMAQSKMHDRVNFFNVAGSTRCNVTRMAEIVVEESGLNADIVYTGGDRGWVGDVPSVEYDTSKIASIGWTPRLDSEGAIRATARWLFDHLS